MLVMLMGVGIRRNREAPSRGTLKRHLANVLDIGVVWLKCTQDGWEFKGEAEKGSSIKKQPS